MADGSQKFTVVIEALNNASGPLRAAAEQMRSLKQPVISVNRAVREFAEASGLRTIAAAAENAVGKVVRLGHSLLDLAGPAAAIGGIASLGGVIEAGKAWSEYGDQLYLAAQKTGVSAEQLQRLHYAAKLTEADTGRLDKSLFRLNATLGDAAGGRNRNAAAMFAALNIPLRDNAGHVRTAASVWGDLSEAIRKNTNDAQRAAIGKAIFGDRIAADLIPMMELGKQKQAELGDESDRLYGKITDGGKSAHEAAEVWQRLGAATEGLRNAIGAALMPTLQPLLTGLTDWIVSNRALISTKVSDWVKSLSDGLRNVDWKSIIDGFKTVGAVAKSVFELLGPKGTAILAGGMIFAPLIKSVLGVGSAFVELGAVLLTNPAGIAIVAFAGLAYLIYRNWGKIGPWFHALWDKVTAFTDAAVKKISGILTWLWDHSPLKLIIDGIKWIANRRAENLARGVPAGASSKSPQMQATNVRPPVSALRAVAAATVIAAAPVGAAAAALPVAPHVIVTVKPDAKSIAAMDRIGRLLAPIANLERKPSVAPQQRPDAKQIAAMDSIGRALAPIANLDRQPNATPQRRPDAKAVAAIDRIASALAWIANLDRTPGASRFADVGSPSAAVGQFPLPPAPVVARSAATQPVIDRRFAGTGPAGAAATSGKVAVTVDVTAPRGTKVRATATGSNPPPLDVGTRFESGM